MHVLHIHIHACVHCCEKVMSLFAVMNKVLCNISCVALKQAINKEFRLV